MNALAASDSFHLLENWQRQPSTPDPRWTGKSVLLIGAKGLVGICCLQVWLASGAKVVALTRGDAPAFTHPNLTWLKGDLQDASTWERWGQVPTTVVTCAPIWLLPPVLERLAQLKVERIVAFSSTSVHTKIHSAKSSDRTLATRLQASEEEVFSKCKRAGIAVTILRPTLIYGIGLDKNIAALAALMRKLPFFPLPLRANGLRQPVHAMDLAQATLDVLAHPQTKNRAYDVGGAERLPYRAMLRCIAQQLGKPVVLVPVPALAMLVDFLGGVLRRGKASYGEVIRRMGKDMVFDDSAARHDFNWQPRPFLDVTSQPADTPFF